jgi:hypothetical protein
MKGSPYLTTFDAAEYLRFETPDGQPDIIALWKWLKRYRVPTVKRGRTVLIHEDDLKAALKPGVTSCR